jgi:hypothetical protein
LWWIRKVSGPNILFLKIDLNRTNFGDTIKMLDNPDAGIHGPVNVEGDLTTNGAKKMPTDPAATPKLNLKDDTYWTGNKNPNDSASDGKWTALIWFNVSKIRKGLDKGATIELKFTVPSVSRGKSTGKIGNYLWVTGAVQPWSLSPSRHEPQDRRNIDLRPDRSNRVSGGRRGRIPRHHAPVPDEGYRLHAS